MTCSRALRSRDRARRRRLRQKNSVIKGGSPSKGMELSLKVSKEVATDSDPELPIARAEPVKVKTASDVKVKACEEDFIPALAQVLDFLGSQCAGGGKQTIFDGVRAPAKGIATYLERLRKYFGCTLECYVMGLVYLDRLVKKQPTFQISPINVHRLIATCLLLAAKMQDDTFYTNTYYAQVSGLSLQEMNKLEAELLRLLGWNLYVPPKEYADYMGSVLTAVQRRED